MGWTLIILGVLLLIATTGWALWLWMLRWFWPRRDKPAVDPLVALYDAEPLALPRAPTPAALPTAELQPVDAEPLTPPHGNTHLAELVRAAVVKAMQERRYPDIREAELVEPDAAAIVLYAASNGRRPAVDLDATGEWPVYEARPIAADTGHQPKHAADGRKYLKQMTKVLSERDYKAHNILKLEQARQWRENYWSLTTGAELARLRAAIARELADWTALTAAFTPRRSERVLVPVRLLELEAAR